MREREQIEALTDRAEHGYLSLREFLDAVEPLIKADALREAADLAENNATAIVNLARGFVANPIQAELATIRAETYREFAENLRKRAHTLTGEPR